MLLDIITYNVAWFVSVVIVGILSGIVWKWKPIVGKIALILFATWFIFSIVWIIMTPVELGGGFSTDRQWYHYIGAFCGGTVWRMVFGVGKNIYTSMVMK